MPAAAVPDRQLDSSYTQPTCSPSPFLFHPLHFSFIVMQGIKFYDPEIVENTPEAVEYRGLQNVLDAVAEHLGYTQGKVWQQTVLCLCVSVWGACLSCNMLCNTARCVCGLGLERAGHSLPGQLSRTMPFSQGHFG